MASIEEWLDMMPSTVTIAPLSSRDGYGAPTYGAAVSHRARIVYRQRWLRRGDGADVVAQGDVWINSAARVDPEDKLTLADGTTAPILIVQTPSDEAGLHHTRITFG